MYIRILSGYWLYLSGSGGLLDEAEDCGDVVRSVVVWPGCVLVLHHLPLPRPLPRPSLLLAQLAVSQPQQSDSEVCLELRTISY